MFAVYRRAGGRPLGTAAPDRRPPAITGFRRPTWPGATPGLKLKGDVGVIYGNAGGTVNAVRSMWSDKTPAVSVNNDVPTEMRMHPNDLGTWILE